MKETEKLDLLLRELYSLRHDKELYSITKLCKELNINYENVAGLKHLVKRLKQFDMITGTDIFFDFKAKITAYGIAFCRSNSFTYKNIPVISKCPQS